MTPTLRRHPHLHFRCNRNAAPKCIQGLNQKQYAYSSLSLPTFLLHFFFFFNRWWFKPFHPGHLAKGWQGNLHQTEHPLVLHDERVHPLLLVGLVSYMHHSLVMEKNDFILKSRLYLHLLPFRRTSHWTWVRVRVHVHILVHVGMQWRVSRHAF